MNKTGNIAATPIVNMARPTSARDITPGWILMGERRSQRDSIVTQQLFIVLRKLGIGSVSKKMMYWSW